MPNLSPESIAVLNFKRSASPAFNQLFEAGITLLDGSKSRDDWIPGECGTGLVPFEGKPKLQRTDWVQNSNDSYWSTNPDQFLTGFSPLFGSEETPLNPRTRLGISMLRAPMSEGPVSPTAPAPAGINDKFSAEDLINVIYNNRSWYADEFLTELRSRCATIGATSVNAMGGARAVNGGCDVLQTWDGLYNLDSVGAHVFRVFIGQYRGSFDTDLTVAFDSANPVATPSTPSPANAGTADDAMLIALANGLDALDAGGISYTETLGNIQYYQPSGGVPPGGAPAVQIFTPIPWHGGDGGVDGTFNAIGVVTSTVDEDTRFPRLAPTTIGDTAGLSNEAGEGWSIARGTSFHFGLEFTDDGPVAFGLTSYSQSTDENSPYFVDQSQRYSDKNYRQFWFKESDIMANLLSTSDQGEVTITQ